MDSLQVGKAGFVSQQYACHHQRDASWHKISQVSQLQLQHPNRHPKRFVFINIPWVILNIEITIFDFMSVCPFVCGDVTHYKFRLGEFHKAS